MRETVSSHLTTSDTSIDLLLTSATVGAPPFSTPLFSYSPPGNEPPLLLSDLSPVGGISVGVKLSDPTASAVRGGLVGPPYDTLCEESTLRCSLAASEGSESDRDGWDEVMIPPVVGFRWIEESSE